MNERIVNPDLILELIAEFPHIDHHVGQLYPELYQDGDIYCCLSGSNRMEGIYGEGATPKEALANWEKSYQKAREDGKI